MTVDDTNATKKRGKASQEFTAEEKAAMRQRVKEEKAIENRADGERAALACIAAMPEADRAMASRVHALITAAAPGLMPKTWYGMPAYATEGKDGKIICFFQPASKFKTRYSTFGFNDSARLDDGGLWPVAFAVRELTAASEAKITELVKRAVK